MSECKFACPVCGQHITANSESGGRHIECPTCFQSIVVPQAPASADSKFILSASQVAKPRPAAARAGVNSAQPKASVIRRVLSTTALLVALAAAATVTWVFRPKPAIPLPPPVSLAPLVAALPKPAIPFPIPTHITWSLDLTNRAFPDAPAAGRLCGRGFSSEKVLIQGGFLSFRQGKRWVPEFTLGVALPIRKGEALSGRAFEFTTNQDSPVPRIFLRWKDQPPTQQKADFQSGFALKLAFGQATNGLLPGRIYLCLPDASKSVLAGAFEAEITHPPPPKPQPLQASQPPKPH